MKKLILGVWVFRVLFKQTLVLLYISLFQAAIFIVIICMLMLLATFKPNIYLKCNWTEYIISVCASYFFLTFPIYSFMYTGTYLGLFVHLSNGFKHYNVRFISKCLGEHQIGLPVECN